MLKRLFIGFFVLVLIHCFCITCFAANNTNSEISNGYFSFTMPKEVQGTYNVSKSNNGIYIIEKISQKLGVGGFAFGVKIFKSPQDYYDMEDHRKIGELTDKNGTIYDMVLIKPREIRYGDGETIAKNYNKLYDLADNLEIKGINGNKYIKNKGIKGEDLYGEVLSEYKSKVNKKLLGKIGYAYYDLNSDGIDELFIGKITNDNSKSTIYDVYTVVNREPMLVVSKGEHNRYFVYYDCLCKEYSESRKDNNIELFFLGRNSTKLNLHIRYMYNPDKNKKNPWFMRYGNNGSWESISKETFNENTGYCKNSTILKYIPLSALQ